MTPPVAPMRVVMVCENFSRRIGGESQKTHVFFDRLTRHGHDVTVVTHERVRAEIEEDFADDPDVRSRVHYVADGWAQRAIWRLSRALPSAVQEALVNPVINTLTMRRARPIVRRLAAHGVDVVWQPTPISPKAFCLLDDVGAPVVIGPMCGGLEYPPGFGHLEPRLNRLAMRIGRPAVDLLHRAVPGKRNAAALVVANERTRRALPAGCRGRVHVGIPESGVDPAVWAPRERPGNGGPVRFVFAGRLVETKGVHLLVEAFARAVAAAGVDAALDVIGSGPMDPVIDEIAARTDLGDRLVRHGWCTQAETRDIVRAADVFVLPSLRECGGNALLEAMASGLAVIATDWAGPAHYVSDECGIKVAPSSPAGFVTGLADAVVRLAADADLRGRMGRAGMARVRTLDFSWDDKVRHLEAVLADAAAGR